MPQKILDGLKEAIAEAPLPIVHFSVDLWTCKVSTDKYIGIHIFWVDGKAEFRHALVSVSPHRQFTLLVHAGFLTSEPVSVESQHRQIAISSTYTCDPNRCSAISTGNFQNNLGLDDWTKVLMLDHLAFGTLCACSSIGRAVLS